MALSNDAELHLLRWRPMRRRWASARPKSQLRPHRRTQQSFVDEATRWLGRIGMTICACNTSAHQDSRHHWPARIPHH
ncbi:MAG: hypothetical protein R2873_27055 [Caldilineaceae bacterium]